MRLFVALPVAAEVRGALEDALATVRDEHPDVTWSRSEGWHVTLAFLGTVEEEHLDAVRATVAGCVPRNGSIRMTIDGAGRLGGHVLVARLTDEPDGAVKRLGATVQDALASADLPVDRKPVRPHLTIGRASRRGSRIDRALVDGLELPGRSWTVDRVELVQSLLGRGPARYEPVEAWSLLT